MKAVRLVAVFLLGTGQLAAQEPAGPLVDETPPRFSTGSRESRPPLIRRNEALIAIGAIVAASFVDSRVREGAVAGRSAMRNDIADAGNRFGTVQFMAPALALSWAAGKVAGQQPVARAALDATAAGVVASGVTSLLKLGIGRLRPRAGAGHPRLFQPFTGNASFPSGHTTFAMAIATSLAHSTPDGWTDVAFYGGAALTGFARINHDKHWLSDVVAGSVVGYLVGRQFTRRTGRVKLITSAELIGMALEF